MSSYSTFSLMAKNDASYYGFIPSNATSESVKPILAEGLCLFIQEYCDENAVDVYQFITDMDDDHETELFIHLNELAHRTLDYWFEDDAKSDNKFDHLFDFANEHLCLTSIVKQAYTLLKKENKMQYVLK